MDSLRTRLLLSHLLLAAVLLLALTGAVAGFLRLSHSVESILEDNYRSVQAAQRMKEALTRIDSAAQFALSGASARATRQLAENRASFVEAYHAERRNITEPGEQELADSIGTTFPRYADSVQAHIAAPGRDAYYRRLEPQYHALRGEVESVIELNQRAILSADERAKAEARRLSSVGIGVTALAVVVSLVMALRGVSGALAPLRLLARQAQAIGDGRLEQRLDLRRHDEIGTLAGAFNDMAERLQSAHDALEARATRAERVAQSALGSLYDPVVVVDAAGRIAYLNRAAQGLFGDPAGLIGRPVGDAVGEGTLEREIGRALREGATFAEEDDSARIAIGERTYRLRVTPMTDERAARLGAVAALEDVTYLKEVDRLKTEFVGVASHELRTPITSLLLSVQLLQEGAGGPLTPPQCEIVGAQRADLERLERLIRDLLDLTRLEAGTQPPRREPVTVAALADAALESVEAEATAKGVALERGAVADGALAVDRLQVVRALVNLLGNAIRHTPPGGTVTLAAQRTPDRVDFSVHDTGEGIPAAWRERIFERFAQVPGATRGGSGLGLALVRSTAQAHGGTVSAQSVVGEGSRFTLSLPFETHGG